jgi:hypothetical protein
MPDLEKRLNKKKIKTVAKVERKNIKSAGKNTDATNKGYDSQKDKNASTAKNVSTARTRTVNKGPKTVSTSTSTREGDRNTTIKNKSTSTSSGAISGSKSDSGSGSTSGSTSRGGNATVRTNKTTKKVSGVGNTGGNRDTGNNNNSGNKTNNNNIGNTTKKPTVVNPRIRTIDGNPGVIKKGRMKQTDGQPRKALEKKMTFNLKLGGTIKKKSDYATAKASNAKRRTTPRGY